MITPPFPIHEARLRRQAQALPFEWEPREGAVVLALAVRLSSVPLRIALTRATTLVIFPDHR